MSEPNDYLPSADLVERMSVSLRHKQAKAQTLDISQDDIPGAITMDMRFPLIDAAELLEHIEPPEYIADGLLEKGVTCGLIGSPESGKSLFVQHMAACVSTGQPFFGREVTPGLVVYLCGEGYHGIARRLQAIEAHHQLGLANAAFVISKCGASFLSAMEVMRVRLAIEAAEQRFGPMVLLIVDTLARFLAPGDESKAQDMGAYLNAVETLRGEATAITLHHPGHGDAQRGRGSSSWRGGIDAEFTLASANDIITVTCQKMKDGERPMPFSFKVTPAPTKLCRDDGSPMNSVVIVPTDTAVVMTKPSGKNQSTLLAELEKRNDVAWTDNELREIARGLGMHKNSARTAVIGLRNLGYLVGTVGGSSLANGGQSAHGTEGTERDGNTNPSRTFGDVRDDVSLDTSLRPLSTSRQQTTPTTCPKCDGEGCRHCQPNGETK